MPLQYPTRTSGLTFTLHSASAAAVQIYALYLQDQLCPQHGQVQDAHTDQRADGRFHPRLQVNYQLRLAEHVLHAGGTEADIWRYGGH